MAGQSGKSFKKQRVDGNATLPSGLNPLIGQSVQDQEKFRMPDGGKGDYELKFYIRDHGSIMATADETEFGGPRPDEWVDFSDRCEINGRNSLVDIGTLTHSIEGRRPNSFHTTLQTIKLANDDYFWDVPLIHSLFTINGNKAFYQLSTGGENNSWFRREVKITLRQAQGEISVEKDLGHFLIEGVTTDSETGIANTKVVGLEKPLIEKDADTVKDGKRWFKNKKVKFLVEELLKTVYKQIVNEKEVLRDGDIVSVKSFKDESDVPVFTDYGKPTDLLSGGIAHTLVERILVNTTVVASSLFTGDTTIIITGDQTLHLKKGDIITLGTADVNGKREKVELLGNPTLISGNTSVPTEPLSFNYSGTIIVTRNMLYLGVSSDITAPDITAPENEGEIWVLDPDRQEFKQLKTYSFFTNEDAAMPAGLIIRKLFYDDTAKTLIGAMSGTMNDTSGKEVVDSAFFRLDIDASKRWDDETQFTFDDLKILKDTDDGLERLFPSNIQYRNSIFLTESMVDEYIKKDNLSAAVLTNDGGKKGAHFLGNSAITTLVTTGSANRSEVTRSDIAHLVLQGGNANHNGTITEPVNSCANVTGSPSAELIASGKVIVHGFGDNHVYDSLNIFPIDPGAGENVPIPARQKVNVVKDVTVTPALLFHRNTITDSTRQPNNIEVPDNVPRDRYAMINKSIEVNIELDASKFTEDFYIYEHEFPDTRTPDGKFRKTKATNVFNTDNLGINVFAQGVAMGQHQEEPFSQKLYAPIITPVIAVYFNDIIIGCLSPRYAVWILARFTVTGVSVTPLDGEKYVHNSVTYIVESTNISGGNGTIDTLIEIGDIPPSSSGTLLRTGAGVGDVLITFTSVISKLPLNGFQGFNQGIIVFSENPTILDGGDTPVVSIGGGSKFTGNFTDLYQIHNGGFDSAISAGKFITLEGLDFNDPFQQDNPPAPSNPFLVSYFRDPTDFNARPIWQFVWLSSGLPTNITGKVRLECVMNINTRLSIKGAREGAADNPIERTDRFGSLHLGASTVLATSVAGSSYNMHFGMIGPNKNGAVETNSFLKIPAINAPSTGFVNVPMGQSIGFDGGGMDSIELVDPFDLEKINLKLGNSLLGLDVFVTQYSRIKNVADKKIRAPIHYLLSRRAGLSFDLSSPNNDFFIKTGSGSNNRVVTIQGPAAGIVNWLEEDIDLVGAHFKAGSLQTTIFNVNLSDPTQIILCKGGASANQNIGIAADTQGAHNGLRLFGPLDSTDYCKTYTVLEENNDEAFAIGIIRGGPGHSELGFKAGIALGNDQAFSWNINDADIIHFFTKKNDKTDFQYFLKSYNFSTQALATLHTFDNNALTDPIHDREAPYNLIKDDSKNIYFDSIQWNENLENIAINKVLKFAITGSIFSTVWNSSVDTHTQLGTNAATFFTSLALDSGQVTGATTLLISTTFLRNLITSSGFEINKILSTNVVTRLNNLLLSLPQSKMLEDKSSNSFYVTSFYWMQSGLQTVIRKATAADFSDTFIVANGNPPVFGDQGELADFTIIDNWFEELFGASQRFEPTLDALVVGNEAVNIQYHVWKLSRDFGGIIPLADFTGLKVWDALGLLAEATNSVMGFDPNGRFFFLQRRLDLTEMQSTFLIDNVENNNLISIKKVLDYKKIFNTIEIIPYLPLIDDPKATVIPASTLDKIRIPFNGVNPVASEIADQRGITSERPFVTANQMDEERKTLVLCAVSTGEDGKSDSGYTSKFKWKIVTDLIRLRTVKLIEGATNDIVVSVIPLDDSKTNIQFEVGDSVFVGSDPVNTITVINPTTKTITLTNTVSNKIVGTDVIIAAKDNDDFKSKGDGLTVAGGYTYSPHVYYLEVGDWYYGGGPVTTFEFTISTLITMGDPIAGETYKDDTATRTFEIISTALVGGVGTVTAKIVNGIGEPASNGVLNRFSGVNTPIIVYDSFATLEKTFFDEVGPAATEQGKRESNQYNPTEAVPEKFYRVNGALSTALNYFWKFQNGIRTIDNVVSGSVDDPETSPQSFLRDRLRTFIELKFDFNNHRFQVGDLIEVVAQGLVLRRNETSKQTIQDFESFKRYDKRELSLNNRFISLNFAVLLVMDLIKKYKDPQYSLTIKGLNELDLNLLDVITVLHNKMFNTLVTVTDLEETSQTARTKSFPGVFAEIEKIVYDLKNQGIMTITARTQKANGF